MDDACLWQVMRSMFKCMMIPHCASWIDVVDLQALARKQRKREQPTVAANVLV